MSAPHDQVETTAGTIRYRDVGSGPVLLFVHGLLFNGLVWRKVVPLLADRFRCVVPDFPLGAHTLAMNPDADLSPPGLARILLEVADTIDGPVTLVGNDTGGAVCQLAAAQLVRSGNTDKLQAVVLTNCDTHSNFLPPLFRPLQLAGYLPGAVRAMAQGMRLSWLWRSPLAYGHLQHTPPNSRVVNSYFTPTRTSRAIRRDTGKVLRGIRKRYTVRAGEILTAFDRPTLLAWGNDDTVFPMHYAERLAHNMPSARLERIDNSSALVPEDQPHRLAEMIAAFAAAQPAHDTA